MRQRFLFAIRRLQEQTSRELERAKGDGDDLLQIGVEDAVRHLGVGDEFDLLVGEPLADSVLFALHVIRSDVEVGAHLAVAARSRPRKHAADFWLLLLLLVHVVAVSVRIKGDVKAVSAVAVVETEVDVGFDFAVVRLEGGQVGIDWDSNATTAVVASSSGCHVAAVRSH